MKGKRTVRYQSVDFSIEDDASKPIFFVLGVRKSGSSVMNTMVNALAKMNGVNYVDVPGMLFQAGVDVPTWQQDRDFEQIIRPGNVYGGFRNAPLAIATLPVTETALKILLVRDPRDALVSEYYSNAFSHSLPKEGAARDQLLLERAKAQQLALEDYVFRMAKPFRDTLRQYALFLSQPNLRLFKYEDAIMDKRRFLRSVCEHFGWRVSDHQLELIMSWADVIPSQEETTKFIRKVIPGDHLEKLSPSAINRLNAALHDELAMLGYA